MMVGDEENIIKTIRESDLTRDEKNILLCKSMEYGLIEVYDELLILGAEESTHGWYILRIGMMSANYSMMKHIIRRIKAPIEIYDSGFLIAMNGERYNHALLVLPFISDDYRQIFFIYVDFLLRYEKFIKRVERNAAKKIYFWWIPICYDHRRECGRRMMELSWRGFNRLVFA